MQIILRLCYLEESKKIFSQLNITDPNPTKPLDPPLPIVCYSSTPIFTPSVQGWGRGPHKTENFKEFRNINAQQGRIALRGLRGSSSVG